MGPTAGIGDAFFFNCLRVIAAGIGIGLCEQGNILGTFLFILIYGVSQLVGRWYLLRIGYSFGTSFIDSIFESGLMEPLTKSAGIVGLTMVGAMVATTVKVKLNATQQEVEEACYNTGKVQKENVKKVIFRENRIINFIC